MASPSSWRGFPGSRDTIRNSRVQAVSPNFKLFLLSVSIGEGATLGDQWVPAERL